MNTWDDLILQLTNAIQSNEDGPLYALVIKLTEELGEFSEVMLHEMGFLKHKNKEWKDTPIEEGADIIIVLLGILAKNYPEKSPEELSEELKQAIIKKGTKYARILGATNFPT